ncbi:sugar transferase [Microbacteriaceae bacterium 4G12]
MKDYNNKGIALENKIIKRMFDFIFSLIGLLFFGWLIVVAFLVATMDTKENGFFTQVRVGKDGKLFRVIKIRTMRNIPNFDSTVTTSQDPRITKSGRFFRKTKIDELPQLINVLLGQMSFVGPRPDVPGFADKLSEDEKIILSIRPGITGPATLKYRNEEEILAQQSNPEKYNKTVIYPDKVRINMEYIFNYNILKDIEYIIQTVFH